MKLNIFLIVFLALTSAANAQVSSTNNKSSRNQENDVNQSDSVVRYEGAKTAGFGFYYSLANRIFLDAVGVKGSLNSTNPFGLGVHKTKIYKGDLGYHAGIYMEFGHSIKTFTLNNVRQTIGDDDKTFTYLYIDPSFTYGVNNQVYFLAGINYSLPTSNIAGLVTKGDVGYQLGTGYQINNNWSVQALYRSIYFRMTDESTTSYEFDSAKMSGLMIRASFMVE